MDNLAEDSREIPEWLGRAENYIPKKDKDAFVDRTILSFLKLISNIKSQDSREAFLFSLNPPLCLVSTVLLIILLSLSRSFVFVIIIGVYLLGILVAMKAETIIKILKVGLVMTAFAFLVTLPALYFGNSYSCIMITSKTFATVTTVGILAGIMRWNDLTSALKKFMFPDIFIFILDITMKYIILLGDLALQMFYALKLRSVGKNKSKYASVSGIAGTIFLKSKEMADEMYQAMECRGFTGEYRIYNKSGFSAADFGYLCINAGIIALFIYFGRQ